jgi:hypothetical protein
MPNELPGDEQIKVPDKPGIGLSQMIGLPAIENEKSIHDPFSM